MEDDKVAKKDKKAKSKDNSKKSKSKDKGKKSKQEPKSKKDIEDGDAKDSDKTFVVKEHKKGKHKGGKSHSQGSKHDDSYDFHFKPKYRPVKHKGDAETDIKKLIKQSEKNNRSAIVEAIYAERPDLIEAIASKGNNLNAQDKKTGQTPIMYAIQHGYFDSVNVLLAKRADLTINDHKGVTPLHLAAYLNQISLAEELIKGGAMVDSPDEALVTPLIIAVRKDALTMVKLLLQNGANPGVRDNSNKTAMEHALEAKYAPLVNVLAMAPEVASTGGDSSRSNSPSVSKDSLARKQSAGSVEVQRSAESFSTHNYSTVTMNIDDPEPEIQSFCQQGRHKVKEFWKTAEELRRQSEHEGPQSSDVKATTKKFEAEIALLDKRIREFRLSKGMGEYAYKRLPFER